MTINIAIVGGNVAADPEYKDMPNGDPVVNFTVATSYKKKDGERVPTYHRCVSYNSGIINYMRKARVGKGTPLVICGERTTRSYDKDGVKHYLHELQIPNYGGKIWVINPRNGQMDSLGDNHGQESQENISGEGQREYGGSNSSGQRGQASSRHYDEEGTF